MNTTRIQQIYGYLVCLIAIITILFSANSFVESVFNYTRPAGVDRWGSFGPDDPTANFTTYKLQRIERAQRAAEHVPNATDLVPDDATLQREFEESKAKREATNKWQNNKDMATSAISLIIGLILFIIHWKWLRNLSLKNKEV